MLIGVLPINFVKWGRVSALSGFLNAFIYLGSSLSAVGIGIIAESGGWGYTLFVMGAVAALVAIVCLASSQKLSIFLDSK